MGGWQHYLVGALFLGGCAGAPPSPDANTAQGETAASDSTERPTHYVDRALGFEIDRPAGEDWEFTAGHDAPEGILVPVVVFHPATGAQVVVQIAPEVAPAQEFAERLAVGLRTRPGFRTTVPEPTRRGSAFAFSVGDEILGAVGITSSGGRLYVLLGTWPTHAPSSVPRDVHAIMSSLKTIVLREASLGLPL